MTDYTYTAGFNCGVECVDAVLDEHGEFDARVAGLTVKETLAEFAHVPPEFADGFVAGLNSRGWHWS
jgi:hypothetical protein